MMRETAPLKLFNIPVGVPFLPTLVDALVNGRLVPGWNAGEDPLKLASATIYVPTRRAARELRSVIVDAAGGRVAILPTIRPLGEFDEEDALFEPGEGAALQLLPPIGQLDRLLLLAPLVQRWKANLPAHVAAMFEEEIVVPASISDALWLARDLTALIDEVETEEADWSQLANLVSGDLASWWQVTLNFLEIVTGAWPAILEEKAHSNPAGHRNALIRAEAARLLRTQPRGPVIAAGSTGSLPATAELLSVIAQLPGGAIILPGLDQNLDEATWNNISNPGADASVLGHPQYGLAKLLSRLRATRADVDTLGNASPSVELRARVIGEALRPSQTTDCWASNRAAIPEAELKAALSEVTLIEASNEHQEALAIAIALRMAIAEDGRVAALVTGDRNLARRVCIDLQRFGIAADDSGGSPLPRSAPATFMRLMLEAVFRPGDPVSVLALLKHPLMTLGADVSVTKRAAGVIELVALRGGTGRPDIAVLGEAFEDRLTALAGDRHRPNWFPRISPELLDQARASLKSLKTALAPLIALRGRSSAPMSELVKATVLALEGLGRGKEGNTARLYADEAGQKLAEFLRSALVASDALRELPPREWPDVIAALIATEVVKPAGGGDGRVFIWGALEARLQSVDTMVLGGLNEGSWPRRADADRFMSRVMKADISLEPPERRIGLAAHDFWTAVGAHSVIITRSARAGDAPAVASRWLQRILAFVGPGQSQVMRTRGDQFLDWAKLLDQGPASPFVKRPEPCPPVASRPKRFSVTEIETLRRDPYALYARRVLALAPIEPLLRDPGAAERGNLFHGILHRFSQTGFDPVLPGAKAALVSAAKECFAEFALPEDVHAIWWPRFLALTDNIIEWERERAPDLIARRSEERATATPVGATGVTLSGRADRIDLRPAGMADILDFKTGSSPSKVQAHTLLAPQLALEAALLKRGAFKEIGSFETSDLAYIRLKGNGAVIPESILKAKKSEKSAAALAEEAWQRLEALLLHYSDPLTGYKSRALPFLEADMDGHYDHLARVLEWSAGAEDPDGELGEGGG
ncbi:double-strand break repair protein AddB [Mesorhizobium sp. NBSH29]|uniref:double-strand break repair protein AddB n=1 Tax=Mesorhizobium sp. NBSH29 TaxID=2654249 RepID=UPI0018968E22|nr:double-strand break repair protein AddB [Mesorhizobium sp. NBSH29]QPC86105.1 double-strand break repair protein AddB [Mesorhizobium sp. NBSH29]